ncbi:hypothetical protein P0F65_16550 [Sphingomonas sp. I4]
MIVQRGRSWRTCAVSWTARVWNSPASITASIRFRSSAFAERSSDIASVSSGRSIVPTAFMTS